ncbi:MAG: TRAP transporter substrate-binding protein [Desulfocapsa sp.]|nr:TRAP transporter substrate-binding protein [Desulfocapsa sp.]
MKNFGKRMLICLTIVCTMVFVQSVSAADFTFKLANVMPAGDHVALACDKFAKLVDAKTDGKIEIKTFHGGQLGSGKETFEAVKSGFLDIATDSYANMYTLTPAFEPFHLPYIFEARNQQLAAFRNPKIRGHVDEELERTGLKWLMALEYAPRQIGTTNKAILQPENLNGLKLRASRSPLEIATHKAWGATGVTVDWPQVPEALRLGMVDGETVGYDSMESAKHHVDSIRYVTELNFQSYGVAIVFNSKKWAKLPDWAKKALEEAAFESMEWHEKMFAEYVNNAKAEMVKAGVKVTIPDSATAKKFRDIAKKEVWPQFVGKTIDKDFVELIQNEVGAPESGEWFKQ